MSEPQYTDHWLWVRDSEPQQALAEPYSAVEIAAIAEQDPPDPPSAPVVQQPDPPEQAQAPPLERELETAGALPDVAIETTEQGPPEQPDTLHLSPIAANQPTPQTTFRLGYDRLQEGDLAGAVEAFQTCLIEQPDWDAAVYNLSLAQWRGGDRELAIATLDQALAQHPDLPAALRLRATLAIDCGDWKTAQNVEARLSAAGENTSAIAYNIGVLQQRAGLHQEAVPAYQHALKQNPNFAEALLNLGHAFKLTGHDRDAQSTWLAALAVNPGLAADYFKPVLQPD